MESLLSAFWSELRREEAIGQQIEWRQPQGSGQGPRGALEHRTPQGIRRGEESRKETEKWPEGARVCDVPRSMVQSVICCGQAGKMKNCKCPLDLFYLKNVYTRNPQSL